MIAIHELVVPKSIPNIFDIVFLLNPERSEGSVDPERFLILIYIF